MSTKRSTAVLMEAASMERTIFQNGTIELWTGAQQASGNNPMAGTKVVTITVEGGAFTPGSPANGLTLDAPVLVGEDAVLNKPAAEQWSGLCTAAGTVASAVYRANAADPNAQSTTHKRMTLAVGGPSSNAEVKLSKLTYAVGEPIVIQSMMLVYGNPLPAV